jgi:hypothetical protein
MAYPEWSVAADQPGGHVHHREMEKFNADGPCFGGGLVSVPRARGKKTSELGVRESSTL